MGQGTQSYTVTVDGLEAEMVSIGGRRSERRKWAGRAGATVFECVSAILFVVSLSDIDEALVEDRSVNRLHESLSVFHELVQPTTCPLLGGRPLAPDLPFWLLFTGTDLLRDKLARGIGLSAVFPAYPADNLSFHSALAFIDAEFKRAAAASGRTIESFSISAIDTMSCCHTFRRIVETLDEKYADVHAAKWTGIMRTRTFLVIVSPSASSVSDR
jgi:hypothetical protein